jgi:hypothetical protein
MQVGIDQELQNSKSLKAYNEKEAKAFPIDLKKV